MALGIFELDLLKDVSDDAFVVKGAIVTVYIEGGGLATLYDDITGTTGPTNPFTLGATESTIAFYADQDNRYRIEIVSGALSRTIRYRSVSTDASALKTYTDAAVSTHSALTGSVHGVASGDAVESVSGAQAKADAVATLLTAHEISATPHPNLTVDFDQVTWPTEYQIGTPTHLDTLGELTNHTVSAGVVHGCVHTNNGDGTVSLDSGYALLHATDDPHLPLYTIAVNAQGPISLTDQSENYIYLDYNAGSPQFVASTSRDSFNCIDKCIAYYIYRDGTNLNIIDAREQNVDGNRKSRRLFLKFQKFIHAYDGTSLGASGLALTVTSGSFFYMLEELPHPAFDTSVAGTANENVFTLWYRDGVGGWTSVADQKTINTVVYDNNTGTPVDLTTNRFGVSWAYITHDSPSSLHVVMGSLNVTSQAEAEAASPPALLPGIIGAHGSLIGFVVYEKSNTVFDDILSAFAQSFTASAATIHNGLSGLQGGTTAEYYHMTAAEYTQYGYHLRGRSIAAPNATVPVHSIAASGSETNIDLVLAPKGNSALMVAIPDNTSIGGNKRGSYSVDFQRDRTSATQVASGSYSGILAGRYNTASDSDSVVVGGIQNEANASASGVVTGLLNKANAGYSGILAGMRGDTKALIGSQAQGGGNTVSAADVQRRTVMMLGYTTDATPKKLTVQGVTAAANNSFILAYGEAYAFTIFLMGNAGGSFSLAMEFKGLVRSVDVFEPIVLVGTPSKEIFAKDTSLATADAEIVIDISLQSFHVQVTGVAGIDIDWVAKIETIEVW